MPRQLPAVGGGPPIVIVAATAKTTTTGAPVATLAASDALTPDAAAVGAEVVALVRAACAAVNLHAQRGRSAALERVALAVCFFESVALRVPEFHVLMDEFVAAGNRTAVRRILRQPGTPGRRRDGFGLVGLVEQVKSEHPGWTATRAVQEIERLRGKVGYSIPDGKTLRNQHAKLAQLWSLWQRSLYVDGAVLVAFGWCSPWDLPVARLEVTTKHGLTIVHPPGTTVTIGPRVPIKGAPNVQGIEGCAEQSSEPTESQTSGVPEQPAGKRRE